MKKVILEALKKYRVKILLGIIFIGLNTYLLTIPPLIIGEIVDMLYNVEQNKQDIINSTYYLIGVCIILLVVRLIWKYFFASTQRGFEKEVRKSLFKRFLRLKAKELINIKNGEIMSYFVKDCTEMRLFLDKILSQGTRIVFTFIITIFQMAKGVNIFLTLAVLFPIFVAIILVIKIKKYLEESFRKSQTLFTDMSEFIQESNDGIKTLKAYSCEDAQIKKFVKKNKKVYESDNTVDIFSNLLKLSLDICFGICYAISLLLGSRLVLDGNITVGELITFNGYIALFVNPVAWLPQLISRSKRAKISFNRLQKLYTLETEKYSKNEPKNIIKLKGDISIKNVSFNYPGSIENSLEDINIEIKHGQTIGIIGTLGSGKTTLMNLLTRLFNIHHGQILIDGYDIKELPLEVLRKNICYITQDNFMFSSSIKDNISLFDEDYEDSEIKESTKKAIVYEDIKEMKHGINTIIEENGTDLSGGQRQRVALSRAFLRDRNILIFDDTFSSLDNNTSEEIISNVKKLAKGKTCIIISNKVSDVMFSNQIVVLNDGKVEEIGTNEELLENDGMYKKFYEHQSKK